MLLSKLEQETVFLFNEVENEASVYTYNGPLRRRLELLSLKFPSEVKLTRQDNTGAVKYSIPKKLISIRQPVSEERKQAARKRALELNLRPPRRD